MEEEGVGEWEDEGVEWEDGEGGGKGWNEWSGLMGGEGKELVGSGRPGGWYIEANDGKGR